MKKSRFNMLLIAALSIALATSLAINITGESKAQVFSKGFSSVLKECVGDTVMCNLESRNPDLTRGMGVVLEEVGTDYARFGVVGSGQSAWIVVPLNSISRLVTTLSKKKVTILNLKFGSGEFMGELPPAPGERNND
jgi:hypothetical protein